MARLDDLLEQLTEVERDIEAELNQARKRWYRLVAGRVRFHRDVRRAQARLRQSVPRFIADGSLINLATAPIIYSLIVPVCLLDLWVTLYQHLCFRAYGRSSSSSIGITSRT